MEREECRASLAAELTLRQKRGRKILFSAADPWFVSLRALLSVADRRAVVLWAFELAEEGIAALRAQSFGAGKEKAAKIAFAENALCAARLWAAGELKMRAAQRAILDCHACAKGTDGPAASLFHAVGQACSVVHTAGHALGFPVYELTARTELALCGAPPSGASFLHAASLSLSRIEEYENKLNAASRRPLPAEGWAGFLRPRRG